VLLYRLLMSLFAVSVALRHGRERLRPVAAPGHPARRHIWLHGASNGELASVRPVLERLIAARPDIGWLVTSNTATGRDMVARWDLPNVSARLAPLDLTSATRRTFDDWSVTAHISLETELWPHRILSCPGPVILLGARMSAGTAKGWGRLPTLARRVLSRIAFASAQDAASLERLHALGLPGTAAGPVVDLKAFYDAPAAAPLAAFERGKTWLAAQTHEGEEEILLDAHRLARAQEPGLRMILAPRHPRRAAALRALIEARGLSVAQRSRGEAPGQMEVYLADTMGEMPLWYASAGRVFVAGSLAPKGGHTPYEPAAFAAAILHGPDLRNFRAAYARLAKARLAAEATDAETLAQALNAWADPQIQSEKGQGAQRLLAPDTGPEDLCAQVLRILDTA
jgi:3-deoxy-D-manno-octulosonic-acid transferase